MKRWLFPIIVILSLVSSALGTVRPVPPVQAAQVAQPLQAPSQLPLPDQDQDGLSNAMETAGWYDQAGGPYYTDPTKADTDGDGLTDGQEKLFNFDPTDPHSPGIAVPYESSFQTLKYFSTTDPAYLHMVQGGNQYLLTEAAVIRRGTTFKIDAVNSLAASLTLTWPLTGTAMTPVTPVRDVARGGWWVTIPATGTVGTYTATITVGAWSKSMPIYVIFEIPADLTQAQINTYLYNADPADKRDEVAVWYRAVDWKYYNANSVTPTPCLPTDPICSNWQYHTNSVYAQAFWTEQFTKNVLVTYTIPSIQGLTDQYNATQAISAKADASVRVNFSSVKNSFSSATKYYYDPSGHPTAPYHMDGGACETSAGVFTSMLRSIGIASRPFALDYNKTQNAHGESGNYGVYEYDTAVMMWVVDPAVGAKQWYAERTFEGAEAEYQPTPSWSSGTSGIRPLSHVGSLTQPFQHFQDLYADNIQSANEGWDFQIDNPVSGTAISGMVNTAWTGIDVPSSEFVYQNRDIKWDSKYPLEIQQSPYVDILDCQLWQGDNWAPSEWYTPTDPLFLSDPLTRTATQTYNLPPGVPSSSNPLENWPYNPKPKSCPFTTDGTPACAAFQAAWQATCAALPGQTLAAARASALQPAQAQVSALNTSMQLGYIVADSGLDQNGDGRFDKLVVQFQLNSSVAGAYQVGGWLRAGAKEIRADLTQVTVTPGFQTLQVTFDGQAIGDNQADGPYVVEALWVAPASRAVSDLALPDEMTAYLTYTYATQAYLASAFAVQAASIAGNYSYVGAQADAKGLFNAVTIAVPLHIAIPGTFTVEGDLYDGRGSFVGHAAWTGTGPAASLTYKVTGTQPPYALQHLNLTDARGTALSSFYAPVYTIQDLGGRVAQANVTPASSSGGVSIQSVTVVTNTFSATPVDTNSNGLYDQLVVSTSINITQHGGSYWMEGLLVDDRGMLVAWNTPSAPQPLIVGNNQVLQMTFDGRLLFAQLPLTGSEVFTLVAVKIFSGSPSQATLEADIPVTGFTTSAYARSQFEPLSSGILFQDDMESGHAHWNIAGSSQWSQTNAAWHSYQTAWVDNGSATADGLLSLAAPLDFTNDPSPWLMFSTAYLLAGGDAVTLEVSTDSGATWTPLKTYTGPVSTAYWSPELVDLSAYGGNANVSLRFNAQSHAGSTWYLDDVIVFGGLVATDNPKPTLTSLSPSAAATGGPQFTLTVNGSDFVNGAVVNWNSSNRPTAFVSSTQLTATISAVDIATAGTYPVTVFNPTPGGGTSNAVNFTVLAPNPVPTLISLSPSGAVTGGVAFTLTVNGSNYVSGFSVVNWNGSSRPTMFVSNTQLTASIMAADIATAGTYTVTVTNLGPGGGTSGPKPFTVSAPNPMPTLTNLSPSAALVGEAAPFTMTVTGTSFVAGSAVNWNGTGKTTTFVSSTQLTASISAADIASAGTYTVTVTNPLPGGGTSGPKPFTVSYQAPPPCTTNLCVYLPMVGR